MPAKPSAPKKGCAASSSETIYSRSMAVKLPPKKASSVSRSFPARSRIASLQVARTVCGVGAVCWPEILHWLQKLH